MIYGASYGTNLKARTILVKITLIKHGSWGATLQELRYGGLRLRLGAFAHNHHKTAHLMVRGTSF